MANVPYSGGTPTVLPETRAPEDYQRIPTRPQEFGAELAQGEERLGQGAVGAARFYGQVAASDANNKLMEGTTAILYGDPDKTTIGPDGRPVPDLGYLGTRGADALRASASTTARLEELRNEIRDNLPTAESQLQFDDFSRRFLAYKSGEIGAHADQQANVWYSEVEKANGDNAITGIRQNPNDQAQVDHYTAMLMQSRIRTISRTIGDAKGPEVDAIVNDALASSRADAAEARIEALIPHYPAQARQVLESPDGALLKGPRYDALAAKVEHGTNRAADDAIVDSIIGRSGGANLPVAGGGQNNPGNIRVPGSTGTSRAAFQSFPTYEAGVAAIGDQLQRYQARGVNTLRGIISTYSPPSENDTGALIRNAAARTGLDPDQKLDMGDAQQRTAVVNAIIQQEQGGSGRPVRLASNSPMQQPVPGFPTREELVARIPDGLSDEQYDRVYAGVNRRYNQMVQATSADRATTLAQYKGGLAMLADGREFNYDEGKIRSLFPKDTADEMISNLQDARTIGQQITAVRGMPLADILNQQAANRAVLANSTGANYERQRKLSAAFDQAAEQHIKALGSDPAAYVSTTNPQIVAAADAMKQETPQQSAALRGQGQPSAAENYAAKVLGEEDRLGVPTDGQHILDNTGATAMAQQIMADPEQAPARLKAMETQWGSAWPKVWQDLGTVGKLPAAYQMVGALENEGDGALLARALGQANKEGVNRSLDDILDKGAAGTTRPSQSIRTRVQGSEDVQSYARSMLASGASDEQVRGIVSSIGLLAEAKSLYHNQEPAAAADDAVQSAIGKWEFLPQGGARIPRANADAITGNAETVVRGLSLAALQPPAIYSRSGQSPGAATADDWLRVLQAAPNWVTVGRSIRLMDNGGRFVRRAGGGFVEVPFNIAAPTPAVSGNPVAPPVVPPNG